MNGPYMKHVATTAFFFKIENKTINELCNFLLLSR